MQKLSMFLILFLAALTNQAQSNAKAAKLPDDFLSFFIGNWTGEGQFASGKKISADASFKLSLDSSWLTYDHTDKLPNRYKALSMWGLEATSGQFVAYAFDNFHGHRKFASNGWKDEKLILSTNEFYPGRGLLFQHFIYEKLTDQSFKMTYETSGDGITWKLGDYLIFTRK